MALHTTFHQFHLALQRRGWQDNKKHDSYMTFHLLEDGSHGIDIKL